MLITPASSYIPRSLNASLLSQPSRPDLTPGLIINAEGVVQQSPRLQSAVDRLRKEHGLRGMPTFLIPPEETAAIFSKDELALLRSASRLLAEQIHPHLKTGVDAVWLVYGAYKLKEDWKKPDRNTSACIFKLADLGLGAAGVLGGVYPDLKLDDAWANGINGFVKVGGSIAEGKTLSMNEHLLSSDKRLDLLAKALKVGGVSLDPEPPTNAIPGLVAKKGIAVPLEKV